MNNKRSGFTLAETVVAAIILTTAITVSTQMLLATSAQHKAMEHGQIAILEAGNVVERLSVLPWSKLTADELSAWKLCPEADDALPAATLEIQIEPTAAVQSVTVQSAIVQSADKPTSNEPASKRLTVIVSYRPKEKQPAHSVRLVTWRYADAIAVPQPEEKDEKK